MAAYWCRQKTLEKEGLKTALVNLMVYRSRPGFFPLSNSVPLLDASPAQSCSEGKDKFSASWFAILVWWILIDRRRGVNRQCPLIN
jgi:hypothetical protein